MKKKFLCLLLCISLFSVLGSTLLSAEPEAPFSLIITTQNGEDPVLTSFNNYKLDLYLYISARGTNFGKAVTFEKITWNNETLELNQTVSADENKWEKNETLSFGEMDGGKTIVFKLYWHSDDEPSPKPISVEFKPVEAKPSMTVRAETEQTSVVPGSLVTINYEAQNNGNVPVQYVTIYDDEVTEHLQSPCIAMTERSDTLLQPGETFSGTASLKLDNTLKIKPHVTFFYEKKHETFGEETQIKVNKVLPSVSLSCENYSVANKGDSLRFTYSIQNTGSVTIKDVHVYDADSSSANLVAPPFDLLPGAKYEGSFSAVIERSGFYKFKVHYTYDGANDYSEISAKTERSVRIPSEVTFRISEISPKSISEPGDMFFSLTVENAGSMDLTDLSISEENGLIDPLSLNVIIPGSINGKKGELTRSVTVHVPSDGTKLIFNLGYRIDNEYATVNTSYTVNFDAPVQTVPFSETPTVSPSAPATQDHTSGLLLKIIFGFLLLCLIACAIILLAILRRHSSSEGNQPIRRKIGASIDETNDTDYFDDELEEDDLTDEQPPENDDTDDEGVRIYRGNGDKE